MRISLRLIVPDPPKSIDATYSFKSVTFQGKQYEYVAYEIDFDQEIYFGALFVVWHTNSRQSITGLALVWMLHYHAMEKYLLEY